MHISDTRPLDVAAYPPADEPCWKRRIPWTALTTLVPAAVLYVSFALLTRWAVLASGAGETWTPPG